MDFWASSASSTLTRNVIRLISTSIGTKEADRSDNLQGRGGQDRTRIDVNEEWELRYWSEKFDCTHGQLKEAVQAFGTSVEDVKGRLGNKG